MFSQEVRLYRTWFLRTHRAGTSRLGSFPVSCSIAVVCPCCRLFQPSWWCWMCVRSGSETDPSHWRPLQPVPVHTMISPTWCGLSLVLVRCLFPSSSTPSGPNAGAGSSHQLVPLRLFWPDMFDLRRHNSGSLHYDVGFMYDSPEKHCQALKMTFDMKDVQLAAI